MFVCQILNDPLGFNKISRRFVRLLSAFQSECRVNCACSFLNICEDELQLILESTILVNEIVVLYYNLFRRESMELSERQKSFNHIHNILELWEYFTLTLKSTILLPTAPIMYICCSNLGIIFVQNIEGFQLLHNVSLQTAASWQAISPHAVFQNGTIHCVVRTGLEKFQFIFSFKNRRFGHLFGRDGDLQPAVIKKKIFLQRYKVFN